MVKEFREIFTNILRIFWIGSIKQHRLANRKSKSVFPLLFFVLYDLMRYAHHESADAMNCSHELNCNRCAEGAIHAAGNS